MSAATKRPSKSCRECAGRGHKNTIIGRITCPYCHGTGTGSCVMGHPPTHHCSYCAPKGSSS